MRDLGGRWAFEETERAPMSREAINRARAEDEWLSVGAHVFRLPGIYGPGRSQLERVRDECERRGIYFILYPKTLDTENIRNYFVGDRTKMVDRRSRCAFPWTYAEVNARGDVTVCHTFYDLTVGNVYEEGILDIWNGPRMEAVRNHLRHDLFPICDACCRYYYDPNKR